MKTLQEITTEITELEKYGKEIYSDKRTAIGADVKKLERLYKSTGTRLSFLKIVQKYLLSEPRQEFVQKQMNDLLRRKKLIEDGFESWVNLQPKNTSKVDAEWQAEYYALNDMKTIKSQIKTLTFILN